MPYKIVLKRLKAARSNITESMRKEDLDKLLKSLFPTHNEVDTSEYWKACGQVRVEKVYSTEMSAALRRKKSVNTAPGIDGVRTSALRRLSEQSWILAILEYCLPSAWRREGSQTNAYLVLIPKEWPLDPEIPRVRPICLLNEVGKLMESIIAERMISWMNENPDSQLSEYQFGFRKGKSTCDGKKKARPG